MGSLPCLYIVNLQAEDLRRCVQKTGTTSSIWGLRDSVGQETPLYFPDSHLSCLSEPAEEITISIQLFFSTVFDFM